MDTELNPYAGQAPQDLYKLLKRDETLTFEQVKQIEAAAFPEPNAIDFEDENEAKMYGQIQTAEKAALARSEAARLQQKQDDRDAAEEWLASQGFPYQNLPDHVIYEISQALYAQAAQEQQPMAEDEEPVVVIQTDDDTMCLVTASGEVIGFVDAPHADLDRRLILEWVGECLARYNARVAGLMAEKAYWIDKINKIYDPQINKQNRAIKSLGYNYEPVAKLYLDDYRENAEARKVTVPKSMKVGLLTLSYAADKSRVDIVSESTAIEWAEENCPEAVKTVKSIGKSLIPAEIKKTLTKDAQDKTGIFWYPGGTNQFTMK